MTLFPGKRKGEATDLRISLISLERSWDRKLSWPAAHPSGKLIGASRQLTGWGGLGLSAPRGQWEQRNGLRKGYFVDDGVHALWRMMACGVPGREVGKLYSVDTK
jgi:hypothetical protein